MGVCVCVCLCVGGCGWVCVCECYTVLDHARKLFLTAGRSSRSFGPATKEDVRLIWLYVSLAMPDAAPVLQFALLIRDVL